MMSACVSWAAAQGIKMLIDFLLNHQFDWRRITSSGGMPSSHTSTVVALCTASCLRYGADSFQFAVTFILASVVMYDAAGVRRETGKQAVILNKILTDNPFNWAEDQFQQKLKEYVGHTPLQVLMGAILGVLIALYMGGFYL